LNGDVPRAIRMTLLEFWKMTVYPSALFAKACAIPVSPEAPDTLLI